MEENSSLIANRFAVLKTLGSGASGKVVLAEDRMLNDSRVAIKLLSSSHVEDEVMLSRCRAEVLLARKLVSPNIVSIFDFNKDLDGQYYITMQYIEGGSLRDTLDEAKSPLDIVEVAKVLLQVSLALDYSHKNGVMHRDLKPENVLLDKSGGVFISDFGLARIIEQDQGLTKTGETVGTPYYMAPELLRGGAIDHRIDVYAFGILAFEMLANRRPFQGDAYMALAAQHFNNPIPDISTIRQDVPIWFQDIIETCTEKKAELRYQSMEEISCILQEKLPLNTRREVLTCPKYCPLKNENSGNSLFEKLFSR